jgi:hypothetical protein
MRLQGQPAGTTKPAFAKTRSDRHVKWQLSRASGPAGTLSVLLRDAGRDAVAQGRTLVCRQLTWLRYSWHGIKWPVPAMSPLWFTLGTLERYVSRLADSGTSGPEYTPCHLLAYHLLGFYSNHAAAARGGRHTWWKCLASPASYEAGKE